MTADVLETLRVRVAKIEQEAQELHVLILNLTVADVLAPKPTVAAPLLTVAELAARLGVSTKWVYRHAKELPYARRVGGTWRFDGEGLGG